MDRSRRKPLILIICDYYLPGFESGGAMRTLVNMVDRLHDKFNFKVITRDHDGPNNLDSYTDVNIGDWNRVGNADVFYLAKGTVKPGTIRQLVLGVDPDAVYVNSFFSSLTVITLLLKRFGKLGSVPIVLAPEGELIPRGGLDLKPLKKKLYLAAARSLSLLDNVIWKAAADTERQDIEQVFGTDAKIFIAPNLPPAVDAAHLSLPAKAEKQTGTARFVFLSRVMRKKNLNWFLELIASVKGSIVLDIYGPVEDERYFDETKQLIERLPDNITANIKGPVEYDKVAAALAPYEFFVLPTLGENFGHIYVEAMAAGLPLLTSDRSPWRDLVSKQVGWDIPLEDRDRWLDVVEKCAAMSDEEYRGRSQRSFDFARAWLTDPALDESNREALRFAAGRPADA